MKLPLRTEYCLSVIVAFILFLSVEPENLRAQNSAVEKGGELAEKLDELIAHVRENNNLVSVSAAIIYGDSIIYKGAFGFADRESEIPATTESVYPIGSITKVFTTTMMMLLVEEGKVKPDDYLNKFISDYNPKSEYKPHPPTTLRQLASHTSGLPRDAGVNFKMNFSMAKWVLSGGVAPLEWYVSKKELLESLPDIELEYRPGSGKHYSNLAFQLLGVALEKAAETKYIDYVKRKIFAPLQLSSMTFSPLSVDEKYRTRGYVFLQDRFIEAPEWKLGSALYSGGIYSNATDLAKFSTVWFDMNKRKKDNLLKEESVELMCPNASSGDVYLGWGKGWIDGHTVLSHSGGHIGYIANATVVPDMNIGVAVMINAYNPIMFDDPAYFLSDKIVKMLLKEGNLKSIIKKEPKGQYGSLNAFEGKYTVSGGKDIIEISSLEDALKFTVFSSDTTIMLFRRVNESSFYLDTDPSKTPILKFNFSQNGKVESLNFAMFKFNRTE